MKRVLAAVFGLAFCLSAAALPVSAAAVTQASNAPAGTALSVTVSNDPTYTVTIPSAVEMDQNGSRVDIVAGDISNLGGKKVSVTLAGTDYFRNQMVLSGTSEAGRSCVLRYQILTDDGRTIETTGNDTASGSILASFTADGTAGYTVRPVIAASTQKGVTYTGTITYGIELTQAV